MKTNTYYKLTKVEANNETQVGFFSGSDLRYEVDQFATNKNWGWRECADGSQEAVSDYVVIARAIPV